MRRAILAALYLPPGVTVDQYLLAPYSTDEVVRIGIFQLQIVIGDLIMVCSSLPPDHLAANFQQKIYRMYHIFDKSLLACVIPSITTAGLFGNSIWSLPSSSFLTVACFVAIGCGLTNQIRHLDTPADSEVFSVWVTACFCVTLLRVLSYFLPFNGSLTLHLVTAPSCRVRGRRPSVATH